MLLNYTLSFTDWKAALRLNRRKKIIRRFGLFIWPPIAIACFSIAAVSSVNSQLFAQCIALGVGAIVALIASPFMRIYVDRRGYRRLFSPTCEDRSCYIDMDDERILSVLPGVSEEKYFWNAIVGFAQNKEMTLLYLDKDKFLLFPTYALSTDQRTELNGLVARNMPRKKK